jgi:hypothetical protein
MNKNNFNSKGTETVMLELTMKNMKKNILKSRKIKIKIKKNIPYLSHFNSMKEKILKKNLFDKKN